MLQNLELGEVETSFLRQLMLHRLPRRFVKLYMTTNLHENLKLFVHMHQAAPRAFVLTNNIRANRYIVLPRLGMYVRH
jgi:hypothetical protein